MSSSVVDEFEVVYNSLKKWSKGMDVDERTLILSASILMVFDIERRGWLNRMEELQRSQRIAQAARDAITKELTP